MKTKLSLLTILFATVLSACGPSTTLEKSWIDPSFTSTTVKPHTKVLVIAPGKDEVSQRVAEDKIVAAMKKGVGVPGYTYLKPTDSDQQLANDRLLKEGFDGVIEMHLKEVQKSVSYNPGTSYGGWYGYRNYSPGYYSEDKTFQVETNFFSLKENKLLWTGTTSTLNPSSFEKTMDDIIRTIKYDLQKKGIIAKQ
jgi:hypothetical protein